MADDYVYTAINISEQQMHSFVFTYILQQYQSVISYTFIPYAIIC